MKLKDNDLTDRIIGQKSPTASTVPPVAETMMFPIAIDQIDEYEGNPRLYENPEFDAIKDSIRERGVIQRIVVTKRPHSDRFVLAQGGNTRLRCLRELYADTGDKKFATTLCEYRVWTNEANLLVGHAIENELRGNLTWHERSHMICNLQSLLEEQRGEQMTARDYAETAQSYGNPNPSTIFAPVQIYSRSAGWRTEDPTPEGAGPPTNRDDLQDRPVATLDLGIRG